MVVCFLDASLDIMDISGQQQMGVMSRIVKIDLDSEQNPVNVPFSSVLEEVFVVFSSSRRTTILRSAETASEPKSATSAATVASR